MRPSLLRPAEIDAFLRAGHWSRDTMAGRYAAYAQAFPDAPACRDADESYSWRELDAATDRLAANLVALGAARDARALVRMPSSCREVVLRIALKKAGIIGAFVPMQWRRKELDYVCRRIAPSLLVTSTEAPDPDLAGWLSGAGSAAGGVAHRIDLADAPAPGWLPWRELARRPPDREAAARIVDRAFAFDEVSLITASSGTSGLAKLCEWPEGAQLCVGRGLAGRLGLAAADVVGVFAPMSGAAGLVVWIASAAIPCGYVFPRGYRPAEILSVAESARVTVGTTVPVVLARLARAGLESFDLGALRVLRIGTAAADLDAARTFEARTGCRVVVASGSMECPGFGHAGADEPRELRLDGSVGLPLPGCRLRIDGEDGAPLPAGQAGELKVRAPFASSGYWNDPQATAAAWSDGWYASGDVGVLDADGRLTLKGRIKEVINRSGHKILPAELEREISFHPDVLECAVVKAPDAEYGEAPWAFVQLCPGAALDAGALAAFLGRRGLARYKMPARVVAVAEFPRIAASKIDKAALLDGALSPARR